VKEATESASAIMSTTDMSSTTTPLSSSISALEPDLQHADQTEALTTVSGALLAQLEIYRETMLANQSAVAFFEEHFKGRLVYRQFVPLYAHLYETLFIGTREELELYFRKRQFEPSKLFQFVINT
jgi:hypothetical protein